MVLVSNEFRFAEVRAELSEQNGIEVREFISPSGLLVQGTQAGLSRLTNVEGVASVQPVPLAMVVDFSIMHAEQETHVRIESWRSETPLPGVDISDNWGMRLHQELDSVANTLLSESNFAETGRYDGNFIPYCNHCSRTLDCLDWQSTKPYNLERPSSQSHEYQFNEAVLHYRLGRLRSDCSSCRFWFRRGSGDFGTRVIGNVDVMATVHSRCPFWSRDSRCLYSSWRRR